MYERGLSQGTDRSAKCGSRADCDSRLRAKASWVSYGRGYHSEPLPRERG